MTKTKLTAEDLAADIAIMVDYDGPGCVYVCSNPEGDHVVCGGEFKTKAAAEAHAQKEVKRLQKLGYTNVEWCANY